MATTHPSATQNNHHGIGKMTDEEYNVQCPIQQGGFCRCICFGVRCCEPPTIPTPSAQYSLVFMFYLPQFFFSNFFLILMSCCREKMDSEYKMVFGNIVVGSRCRTCNAESLPCRNCEISYHGLAVAHLPKGETDENSDPGKDRIHERI